MADWIGRVYDQYAAVLYRYAVMLLGSSDGASDAVHEVFLALLQRRNKRIDELSAYLRVAVRNRCYSQLRNGRRSVDNDRPLLEPVSTETDPSLRLVFEAELRLLPPEQREVLHLKVFEGWTFQEIATLSGESLGTVTSRYRYAVDKLRVRLK
ncbi:MAG: RNA polymerase sigma factor [Vicinamibacterales bacterium]